MRNVRISLLLALVAAGAVGMPVTLGAQAPAGACSTSAATAEATVRRFWSAFERADWDELAGLVQPGFVHRPPGQSRSLAQFIEGGTAVHRAFADYRFAIDELVVAGDTVAIRWTATGRHVGSFFGEMPTAQPADVQGMHFNHLVCGRIVDDVEVIDLAGLRRRLSRP